MYTQVYSNHVIYFKHVAETRTQNMFEWISLHDNCV